MTHKIRAAIVAAIVFATTFGMQAEIPAGYYSTLNGKSDAQLKTAIYSLVRNFTLISGYTDLPRYFQKTDVYPQSNRWWDMYSDVPLYAPSFSGLNREHSFPKSWWGGSTTVSAYVDLNHLYPSEMAANTAKSNFPLGEVDMSQSVKFNNGVSVVGYPVTGQGGGAKSVFQPAKEYRGDFARTYFYMVTCYQDLTWNKSYMWMLQQNTWPTLTSWSIQLLLKWHREDPVSEKETLRNEQVYKIQNNRNPFIDYPELAEHIWGNKQGVPFNLNGAGNTGGTPTLITPVQDMALEFGQVAIGASATAQLFFNGENLTEPVSLTVYTGNRDMYSIPTRTIAAQLVNGESGYWLPVTYTPTAEGQHISRILIQGGGIPGSRGIELRGECLPVPHLSAPVATEATDISADGYTANWTPAPDETVDYFVVTRTIFGNGTQQVEEIIAEEPGQEIMCDGSGATETYSVQSVRLGYRSPASNVVTVQTGDVPDITVDAPFAVMAVDGGIRFVTTAAHTGVRIYDATGRLMATRAQIASNTDIDIAPGVYVVTTDQCRHPQRVSVR